MKLRLRTLLETLAAPTAPKEDDARRQFILHILLLAIISFCIILIIVNAIKEIGGIPVSVSPFFILFPCFIFLALYVLSKRGHVRLVSFIFIGIFFALNARTSFAYGIDIPGSLLVYSLIIIMAGILISTRFAFLVTFFTAIFVGTVGYLQILGDVSVEAYWRREIFTIADMVMISVIFSIIAVICWLSNREIERSLLRARRSEAALKQERDSLEITVEEKTKELREAQAEKMAQLYRFAEFGRLSSGLFHDLINPLSAVSLTMEKMKNEDSVALSDVKTHVERAVLATKKMEALVATVRKQLSRETNNTIFDANEEVRQVAEILSHKAATAGLRIEFFEKARVRLYGDAIKLHYAILNLVANALDAGAGEPRTPARPPAVHVRLERASDELVITVTDFGSGIRPEHLSRIFEPFFTTKSGSQGTGVGLSVTKRIIEKDFGGTIGVVSEINRGSTFTVRIPIRLPKENA